MTSIVIPTDELLPLFGDNGENWIQGQWRLGDGLCLHEGIKRCVAKQPGDFQIIEAVAAKEHWATNWNDRAGRTWDEVKAKIFEIAEITPGRLEATFGPQWTEIVDLTRRAAVLTGTELAQLAAARDAVWAAAWAARDAAGAAAGAAAGDAAWAAWAAAGDAAGDAARALVVRGLIGQHGLTQDHYDALTTPWRTVIGPIHADDADIKETTDA